MWKCQPDRWLSDADQRHEFVLGTLNMAIGGALSGIIACYIINGGQFTKSPHNLLLMCCTFLLEQSHTHIFLHV